MAGSCRRDCACGLLVLVLACAAGGAASQQIAAAGTASTRAAEAGDAAHHRATGGRQVVAIANRRLLAAAAEKQQPAPPNAAGGAGGQYYIAVQPPQPGGVHQVPVDAPGKYTVTATTTTTYVVNSAEPGAAGAAGQQAVAQSKEWQPATGADGKPLAPLGTETTTQTSVIVVPPTPVPSTVTVPVPPSADGTGSTVVVVPGQQPPTTISLVPSQAATPGVTITPTRRTQMGCIQRGAGLSVLAVGDSITQGSVPSKNLNHPYTIRLRPALESLLGQQVMALDAGLGGGGVFMEGFNHKGVTFGPWLDTYMAKGPWSVAVVLIGINDLLRGGRAAADIAAQLSPMLDRVLAADTHVLLIPPFAAPGFVQESDSKEAERRRLAGLFHDIAAKRAAVTGPTGAQVWLLDLQSGPMDFYRMSPDERAKWLDDGLHMTEFAYDQLGEAVARELAKHACSPVTADSS